MNSEVTLHLYEEVLLLALREDTGTVRIQYPTYALAGAVMAEFLESGAVSVEATRQQLVDLVQAVPTGDPVLDDCLEKLRAAKRRASLRTWITRLAGIKQLRHKAAAQLCRRGILRAEDGRVLWLFTRKVYPERNPEPEHRIVARIRSAIYESSRPVEARTVALIALADAVGLLKVAIDRKELKSNKARVREIVAGDVVGKAVKAVIQAAQSAAVTAVVVPGLAMGTMGPIGPRSSP